MTSKEDFIRTMKKFHPELSLEDAEKKYVSFCELEKRHEEELKKSRHILSGTETITYKSWMDFDIVGVYAKSPHPLKSVRIGHMYKGDVPCVSKDIKSASVSTDISLESTTKGGIPLKILSLDEAVSRARKIDWSKVKIEK